MGVQVVVTGHRSALEAGQLPGNTPGEADAPIGQALVHRPSVVPPGFAAAAQHERGEQDDPKQKHRADDGLEHRTHRHDEIDAFW